MAADPGPPSVDPVPTVPDLVLPGAEVWLLALGAASPTMAAVSAALRLAARASRMGSSSKVLSTLAGTVVDSCLALPCLVTTVVGVGTPPPVPAPWTLWSPAARVPSTAAVARASRHASAMDLAPCGMWLPVISRRVLQLVGRYTPGEILVRYFTRADNDDTMRCRSPFLKALFEASLPLSICWLGMGTGQEKS